jgi:hypothetical protein
MFCRLSGLEIDAEKADAFTPRLLWLQATQLLKFGHRELVAKSSHALKG